MIKLKKILKLEGAQKLTTTEQKKINGSNVAPFYCDKSCVLVLGVCIC